MPRTQSGPAIETGWLVDCGRDGVQLLRQQEPLHRRGGMLTTDDDALAARTRVLGLHGMSRDAWKRYSSEGKWFYEVVEPGFKYNMTDIQAALGFINSPSSRRLWAFAKPTLVVTMRRLATWWRSNARSRGRAGVTRCTSIRSCCGSIGFASPR